MQIILLSTGEGICRAETMYLNSGVIPFEFVGAPAYAVITAISDNQTIRRNLTDKNVFELNAAEMDGDYTFTVSSRDKVWYCDGIRIEHIESGDIRVCSLSNCADHFKTLTDELTTLKNAVAEAKEQLVTLRTDLENEMKQYHIM